MANEAEFAYDNDFYRIIFEEFSIECIGDVSVSQVLTIDTQHLANPLRNKIKPEPVKPELLQGRFQKPLSSTDIKEKQRNADSRRLATVANEAEFDLVDDNYFYRNVIFQEFPIEGIGDVHLCPSY